MKDLCHKLAELGWLYNKVQKFIDTRSRDEAYGLVGQVCACVRVCVCQVRACVCVFSKYTCVHGVCVLSFSTLHRHVHIHFIPVN